MRSNPNHTRLQKDACSFLPSRTPRQNLVEKISILQKETAFFMHRRIPFFPLRTVFGQRLVPPRCKCRRRLFRAGNRACLPIELGSYPRHLAGRTDGLHRYGLPLRRRPRLFGRSGIFPKQFRPPVCPCKSYATKIRLTRSPTVSLDNQTKKWYSMCVLRRCVRNGDRQTAGGVIPENPCTQGAEGAKGTITAPNLSGKRTETDIFFITSYLLWNCFFT